MAERRSIYNQVTELTNRIKNGRRHNGALPRALRDVRSRN